MIQAEIWTVNGKVEKMKHGISPIAVVTTAIALLASLTLAQAEDATPNGKAQAAAPWKPKILADGQPDVSGFWRPQYSGSYSLVNGGEFGLGGWPGMDGKIPPRGPDGKIPTWENRPSRITNPADGQVPYQSWARDKQQDLLDHFENPTQPGYVEGLARCFPSGVSRQQFSISEIRQYPDYVVIVAALSNRIIHLDKRPHIPEDIKLWMSDSRGHWEGNTLVVDVTNSNSKHRLSNQGDFASDKVHITERFIFKDANTYIYEATYEDSSVFTRPWILTSTQLRAFTDNPAYESEEFSCHEGDREFYALDAKPAQSTQ